jgi:hypothetical protein
MKMYEPSRCKKKKGNTPTQKRPGQAMIIRLQVADQRLEKVGIQEDQRKKTQNIKKNIRTHRECARCRSSAV